MMPRSVAASVSMSSTPTVYLATMRSRCDASITRRLIGVWRIEVPISATQSRACDDHVVLVMGARQLPVAVADHDLAAEPLDRLDGLGRLLARGEDQDFRLVGHGSSVAGGAFAR